MNDPILQQLVQTFVQQYQARVVILYGSRAAGTARPDSDYDVAAFAPVETVTRYAQLQDGHFLDGFIYPIERLHQATPELIHFRLGKVLVDDGGLGERFISGLQAIFLEGPPPVPPDELQAMRVWAHKMVARAGRGDVEGNFRRAWLLSALLQDHCSLTGQWYLGPGPTLQRLKAADPESFDAYQKALEPGASLDDVALLVRRLVPMT